MPIPIVLFNFETRIRSKFKFAMNHRLAGIKKRFLSRYVLAATNSVFMDAHLYSVSTSFIRHATRANLHAAAGPPPSEGSLE